MHVPRGTIFFVQILYNDLYLITSGQAQIFVLNDLYLLILLVDSNQNNDPYNYHISLLLTEWFSLAVAPPSVGCSR